MEAIAYQEGRWTFLNLRLNQQFFLSRGQTFAAFTVVQYSIQHLQPIGRMMGLGYHLIIFFQTSSGWTASLVSV